MPDLNIKVSQPDSDWTFKVLHGMAPEQKKDYINQCIEQLKREYPNVLFTYCLDNPLEEGNQETVTMYYTQFPFLYQPHDYSSKLAVAMDNAITAADVYMMQKYGWDEQQLLDKQL